MSYFVYAIKSKIDGRIYVGMSADVAKRIKENNTGKTKSTKGFRPWYYFLPRNVNPEQLLVNLKSSIKEVPEKKN